MLQQKTRQKWALASVAFTYAYTEFILSRQATSCTQATVEFYKHIAGALLSWVEVRALEICTK
jgi:hypothetical protein